MYLLGDFQSYSALSSQKPQTYPKLDIRNFYLEKQSDMTHDQQPRKLEKSDVRMFSYLAHLRDNLRNGSQLQNTRLSKDAADRNKFTSTIKKYWKPLQNSSTIQVEDVRKIENKSHKINQDTKTNQADESNVEIFVGAFGDIKIIADNDKNLVDETKQDETSTSNDDDSNISNTREEDDDTVAVDNEDSQKEDSLAEIYTGLVNEVDFQHPLVLQTSIVMDKVENEEELSNPFERPIIVSRPEYRESSLEDNENLLHPQAFNFNLNEPDKLSEIEERTEAYQVELAQQQSLSGSEDKNLIPLMTTQHTEETDTGNNQHLTEEKWQTLDFLSSIEEDELEPQINASTVLEPAVHDAEFEELSSDFPTEVLAEQQNIYNSTFEESSNGEHSKPNGLIEKDYLSFEEKEKAKIIANEVEETKNYGDEINVQESNTSFRSQESSSDAVTENLTENTADDYEEASSLVHEGDSHWEYLIGSSYGDESEDKILMEHSTEETKNLPATESLLSAENSKEAPLLPTDGDGDETKELFTTEESLVTSK